MEAPAMTPIERRILINQRSIMRALAILVRAQHIAGTDSIFGELMQDDGETLKMLKTPEKRA